jgi:hypothetical protein
VISLWNDDQQQCGWIYLGKGARISSPPPPHFILIFRGCCAHSPKFQHIFYMSLSIIHPFTALLLPAFNDFSAMPFNQISRIHSEAFLNLFLTKSLLVFFSNIRMSNLMKQEILIFFL